MTTNVQAIPWQPFNQATLVANINADFTADGTYTIATQGPYQTRGVQYANGVIIDNQANNGFVQVTAGPVVENIAPFNKSFLQLDRTIGNITVTGTVGDVQVTLFAGVYPGNSTGFNYAGAQALGSLNAFVGGLTTGTANAQVLAAVSPSGYTLSQGALITATAGFTNTGALTLDVNGQGAIAVHKITAAGSIACTGGELQLDCNFTVSTNILEGIYELVSSEGGIQSISAATNSGIDIGGTTNNPTVTLDVINLLQANPAQAAAIPFSNGGGAATEHTAFAGSASSLVAAGAATKAQMQAATDATVIVTPAHVNDADGAAKAWVVGGSGGGFNAGLNIASVVRNSTGFYTVTWTVPFSSVFYAVVGMVLNTNANRSITVVLQSAAAVNVQIQIANSAANEDDAFYLVAFGRQ